MKKIRPIFVFSMPRSGSTLLQRVLMSHSKISTTAEPHFLLPLVYMRKKEGVVAEYSHQNVTDAIKDLIKRLPNKNEDFDQYIKEFTLSIYKSLSDANSIYFIDKTPEYYLIIEELERIFPDGRFIFLWRSPVQSFASAIETFGKGRFRRAEMFYLKASSGFSKLVAGFKKIESKSFCLKYEDFVSDSEKILRDLTNYLELDFEKEMLHNFSSQKTHGRLGDPSGIHQYKKINTGPKEKWKTVFNSRYRKVVLKDHIKDFDEDLLKSIGYNKRDILNDINAISTTGKHSFIRDFLDIKRGELILRFNLNVLFGRNLRWAKNKYLS